MDNAASSRQRSGFDQVQSRAGVGGSEEIHPELNFRFLTLQQFCLMRKQEWEEI